MKFEEFETMAREVADEMAPGGEVTTGKEVLPSSGDTVWTVNITLIGRRFGLGVEPVHITGPGSSPESLRASFALTLRRKLDKIARETAAK